MEDSLISRKAVIDCYKKWQPYMSTKLLNFEKELYCIPSVTPSYNSIKTELKPSEDCISRQKVLDTIDAYKYLDGNDAIYRLKQWLNEQESVQPKMGRWIMPQMDDGMSKSTLVIDTPNNCGDCPFCIFTAEEKRYIGYCHTSDDDYYCKVLDRFMEYDKVDGGVDILGKPTDCPLQAESEDKE